MVMQIWFWIRLMVSIFEPINAVVRVSAAFIRSTLEGEKNPSTEGGK
jgi:hypothetical protein